MLKACAKETTFISISVSYEKSKERDTYNVTYTKNWAKMNETVTLYKSEKQYFRVLYQLRQN